MSQEIRPGEAMASLTGINQELNNISSSVITPIRTSISDFDGNTELQGVAFDNLRAHMSGEINDGLLNQLVTASNALREANSRHISALSHISQYGVINQEQLAQDIGRVHERITDAENNGFAGVAGVIAVLHAELNYLNQKSMDFGAYLRYSSGLYDGLFFGLEVDVSRMNIASFCRDSGVVSLPTAEEMIFQMEVDRAMGEMFPYVDGERQVCWDTLQEVLGRPYTEISEAEFAVMAMLFISFDLEYQERFLNYLIDQIEAPELAQTFLSGELEGFDSINGHPENILLYMFCPEKVAGIQRHLNNAIALVWQTEMGLEEDHPYRNELRDLRNDIMQRSALLSTVSTMMGDSWGDDAHRVQYVFVEREESPSPIRLGNGNPEVMVYAVSMARSVETFVDGTSRIYLMSPENRVMRVDRALDWNRAGHQQINLAESHFTSMHGFNLSSHHTSVVAGALATVLTIGLKKPASIALKIVETANKAFGTGVSSAEARAERIQGDFSQLADYGRTALAFRTFGIEVVFVEIIGDDGEVVGFETHMFPTPITMERIDALNDFAGTDFSVEDLPAILEEYFGIAGDMDQLGEFYELIGL